jgi:site-specific recombinase XerD
MIISDAIEKYLQRVRSRSVATERTYATGLRRFQEYLAERALPAETTDVRVLTPPVFQDYIAWLDQYLLRSVAEGDKRHVSQSTKKTYLAAVLGLLDYLVVGTQLVEIDGRVYDTLRRDLARAGKRRGGRILSPDKVPSAEIVQALLEQAREPFRPPKRSGAAETHRRTVIRLRNLAIVEALVSSGMRVG